MSTPSSFENVTALTKANVYFDGKVVSHTILLADGSKKTLGVIFPGSYEFDTAVREQMLISSGACRVLLPGDTEWQVVSSGQSFDVPAKAIFQIAVDERAEYVCSYF